MSEQQRYEEILKQKLHELPLPDENMAWADMKRRLDEEEDDRPFIWWWKSCLMWGIAGALLLGSGWWFFYRNDKNKNSRVVSVEQKITVAPKENEKDHQAINSNGKIVRISEADSGALKQHNPTINVIHGNSTRNDHQQITDRAQADNLETTVASPAVKEKPAAKTITNQKKKADENNQGHLPNSVQQMLTVKNDSTDGLASNNKTAVIHDKKISIKDTAEKKDSIQKLITEKTVDSLQSKTKEKKKPKSLFYSAGIALHQQLPVAGQKLVPYAASGRKNSLADYIPSAYFRINKKDKWFIQAEFRYGAPHYVKEFTYREQQVPDTGQVPLFTTITSSQLKKTFYHQLPVTFNYYVVPNWSVGAGVQWNRFYGLVAERSVIRRTNNSQRDTVVSKLIIEENKDSATEFSKNYLLAVFETQYQWKRFSIGAKYSFGLQPYIQFKLPGGSNEKERSHAVQVFLRYQLWRSKEN